MNLSHLHSHGLHCLYRISKGGDPIERIVHAPVVKMESIKIVYEDDTLVINGYCCTKQQTLAIANLLIPDYKSIVEQAREEQRLHEAERHVHKVDRVEAL